MKQGERVFGNEEVLGRVDLGNDEQITVSFRHRAQK